MTSVVDKENVVVKFYTNQEISCDKNNKRITITTYEPIYNFAIKKIIYKYDDGYEFDLLKKCKCIFLEHNNRALNCWFPKTEKKRIWEHGIIEIKFVHIPDLTETIIDVDTKDCKHTFAC